MHLSCVRSGRDRTHACALPPTASSIQSATCNGTRTPLVRLCPMVMQVEQDFLEYLSAGYGAFMAGQDERCDQLDADMAHKFRAREAELEARCDKLRKVGADAHARGLRHALGGRGAGGVGHPAHRACAGPRTWHSERRFRCCIFNGCGVPRGMPTHAMASREPFYNAGGLLLI